MTETKFEPLNAEPIDPIYKRFRDGWAAWIINKMQDSTLRWSPSDGGGSWRLYKLEKFDHLDFGAVGPESPLKSSYQLETGHTIFVWKEFRPRLPDLWRSINTTFAKIKTGRPSSVWNPYDGSWREVRSKPEPYPDVPGGRAPGDSY